MTLEKLYSLKKDQLIEYGEKVLGLDIIVNNKK
jgi:flagellar motor switch/type III secretory pathway protein FliN